MAACHGQLVHNSTLARPVCELVSIRPYWNALPTTPCPNLREGFRIASDYIGPGIAMFASSVSLSPSCS